MKRTIPLILALFSLTSCGGGGGGEVAPHAALGPVGAPVTIEEFSDFQCPACGQVSPQVEEIARSNPSLIRLEFHHFPLPQHENAFNAAVAAECANGQGKFWEYGKLAFANQKDLSLDNLKSFAKTLGLDVTAFNACLDGAATADRVREDLKLGADKGVGYTPSLYVNGQLVQFTDRFTFEGYLKNLK